MRRELLVSPRVASVRPDYPSLNGVPFRPAQRRAVKAMRIRPRSWYLEKRLFGSSDAVSAPWT